MVRNDYVSPCTLNSCHKRPRRFVVDYPSVVSCAHEYQQFSHRKLGNPKFQIGLRSKRSPHGFEHKCVSAHIPSFSHCIEFFSKLVFKPYWQDDRGIFVAHNIYTIVYTWFSVKKGSPELAKRRQDPTNEQMTPKANVNVTLDAPDWFRGKRFPCPVCSSDLALRVARTQKPYCHCDSCGLQLFIRGKNGIHKLKQILASGVFTSGVSRATELLSRLQKLKEEKERFEDRQGFLFRDRDLDQAIRVVDQEIEAVRRDLAELADVGQR
jgi:hypothetical protein